MKRQMSFLVILSLMVSMGGSYGCRKDETPGSRGKQALVLKSIAAEDAEIEKKILSFVDQCQHHHEGHEALNPHLLSVKTTLWLTEGALNYVFGHPKEAVRDRILDTIYLSFPIVGDSVDSGIAAQTANQLMDSLSKFYAGISGFDKRILSVTVSKFALSQAGQQQIQTVFELGRMHMPPSPYLLSFDNTNWWFWGFGQGKCDLYAGNNFGSDATTVMMANQSYFFSSIPVPIGFNIYYTDFVTRYAQPYDLPNVNDLFPGDNQFDYLVYLSNPAWPNFHECLSPAEMTFYFNRLGDIVWHKLFPVGLTQFNCHFVSLLITSNYISAFQNPSLTGSSAHKLTVKYGQPHYMTDPGFPLAAPLFSWH
ncbi:MAG: hypothetical protein WCO63_14260 [Bacteroidota bacterium]